MKKIRTIDVYHCDYCGNECEHTPDLVLPVMKNEKCYAEYRGIKLYEFIKVGKIFTKQVDICPECQTKIAKVLTFLPQIII